MKRVGILRAFAAGCLIAALAHPAGASAAAEGQRRPYVVTINYTGFGTTTATPFPAVFTQEQFSQESVGGTAAGGRPSSRKVDVRIKDVTGRRAAGWVYYVEAGAGSTFSTKLICSATRRPLTINSKYAVLVILAAGDCAGEPSIPTRGSVRFSFTE